MKTGKNVKINENGGFYTHGTALSDEKYCTWNSSSSTRRGVVQPSGWPFVVDNCSIHMKGENELIVEALWEERSTVMIPLPPYTPELNPIELVFGAFTARLKANRSRSKVQSGQDFAALIQNELDLLSRGDIKRFYRHCGYRV